MSTGRQVAKARACKARIAGSTPVRCSSYALLVVIAIQHQHDSGRFRPGVCLLNTNSQRLKANTRARAPGSTQADCLARISHEAGWLTTGSLAHPYLPIPGEAYRAGWCGAGLSQEKSCLDESASRFPDLRSARLPDRPPTLASLWASNPRHAPRRFDSESWPSGFRRCLHFHDLLFAEVTVARRCTGSFCPDSRELSSARLAQRRSRFALPCGLQSACLCWIRPGVRCRRRLAPVRWFGGLQAPTT